MRQARVEIGLLQLLNSRCDPQDEHHIVRMVDYFLFRKVGVWGCGV